MAPTRSSATARRNARTAIYLIAFLYNALGGAVWASMAILVGYLLGETLLP